MFTNITKTSLCLLVALSSLAFAGEGASIFHAFKFEADVGDGRDGTFYTSDVDGWVGGDINKIWLKIDRTYSEDEQRDGKVTTEEAELWAMYSRNVATFWDVQIGLRHDSEPHSLNYFVVGFEGLAPYFFETQAHLFVSEEGDVTARIRQENDLLITQRLIIQPYFEFNLSAEDVPEQKIGSGLTHTEVGLQACYEISRKFTPYLDVRYEREFGKTASAAEADGEGRDDFVVSAGLRLLF